MGLFSNKPKVDMETLCRDYYDSQMFHKIVDGEDGTQKILKASYELLTDSYSDFLKVDRELFDSETTAMNLALFALAFFRRFSDFNKAVKQVIFTLHYLQEKKRNDIWESMRSYNKVIAQTATLEANGQPMSGETRIGRMTIIRVNERRVQTYGNYLKTHSLNPNKLSDEEEGIAQCVAYACNHIEADILRHNEIGNRLISGLFLYRLGAEALWGENWHPSEDFLLRVASQPYSMYEFATKSLKAVDVTFS